MTERLIKKILFSMILCAGIFSAIPVADAEIVKGYAPIENGDIEKARAEARRYAMRELVERVVGVKVTGTTEVANFAVIKDEIVARSEGYVTINRVISEGVQGDVFYSELDLTANADKIRSTEQDLRTRIEIIAPDSNYRGRVQVAVVQRDSHGRYGYDNEIGTYVSAKLKYMGFDTMINDEVNYYLTQHGSDPDANQQARRIARGYERGDANSLLRGVIATENVRPVGKGLYEAIVNVSFEVIGLDSNEVDAFSRYFKAVGHSEKEAIFNAKEKGTEEAVTELAKQALETVQAEQRGGYTNLKSTVIFDNVTNYSAQFAAIKAGLERAHCKIIRVTRPSQTRIAVFVSSDFYTNLYELESAIESAIPGIGKGVGFNEDLGASKIKFTF